ncbi:LON peptidase N-terminal domain and RING finger protein 3 [Neocloeon triangulifer]|uniref:LON peptidase N-terminal domain and RING finger protein 3 n=1 Tax=Neocloeon triangulifer TaxID=2078957 RepID=UPI00286FA77A|nr:LON peptidase N-terminal domain and RING finger protein 3 [Neocloeon triangulifer]
MNVFKVLLLQLFRLIVWLLFQKKADPIKKRIKMNAVDVAQDAFNSRNFRLAAEMYKKCVNETVPGNPMAKLDLQFGYADSLANCGRLREAVAVYTCIYKKGCAPEKLRHLATALIGTLQAEGPPLSALHFDPLACVICGGVLKQPTSWNCGHCACLKCDQKQPRDNHCPRCGKPKGRSRKEINVLANNLVQKLWPHHLSAATIRDDGNNLFKDGCLKEALEKYNAADELVKEYPLTLANRSHVSLSLSRAQAALADAETVIKRWPHWPKGYFRRSMALASLGRHEEALVALASCIALEKNPHPLRHDLCLALHRVLIPSNRSKSTPFWIKRRKRASSDYDDSGDEDLPQHQQTESRSRQNVVHGIIDRVLKAAELLKSNAKTDKKNTELLAKQTVCPAEPIDFECVLCSRTLWRPVTTQCGHTYCWTCLDRCIDYSHPCPLCMSPLTEGVAGNERSVSDFVEKALSLLLPEEYELRKLQEQEQTSEPHRRVPVFVCTTGFPGIPCPLFIYEPRYRLMIRRAVENGNRQFGMAAYLESEGRYADFGTMLEIRDTLSFNNGCSIVTSIGVSRFKVLSRGEKDGYNLAQVELLKDEAIPEERLEVVSELHNEVRARAQTWLMSLPQKSRSEIEQTFGPMPDIESDWNSLPDGPQWTWWLMAILPLGSKLKVGILSTTSLEKRMRAINKTLEHLTFRA